MTVVVRMPRGPRLPAAVPRPADRSSPPPYPARPAVGAAPGVPVCADEHPVSLHARLGAFALVLEETLR